MGEAHAPNANTGSVGRSASEAGLRSDAVATDSSARSARVRKANQSHAFDSPMPGEGKEARTARPDEGGSMLEIKQFRLMSTQPRVAQPHR